MKERNWIVKLLRLLIIVSVLIGCLVFFFYTPFYSNAVVRTLNAWVPVEVNQVAAQSQQQAALTESENLEPGSDLWIARQAYFKVIEEALHKQNVQELNVIQARYKILQQEITDDRTETKQKRTGGTTVPVSVPLKAEQFNVAVSQAAPQNVQDLLDLNRTDYKKRMDQYMHFLQTHPIDAEMAAKIDEQVYKDIAHINTLNDSPKKTQSQPYAIVVLGGGLTQDKTSKAIVVNEYTRLRLETTLALEQKTDLPIVLSGVEAPYMQAWLAKRGLQANLLENKSMNTCENTRFSSLLLQKKGGAPTVLLITDRYHMPRTRRLFALNGIETIPVEAPMPTQLTAWQPSKQNYDHSRRANYETLATIRDMLFGSSGCREVP
ncbi:YdcF family protein [Acinetobacter pullicarnis]|uniref:YdcF family protein n=1 Tax=Acinetobacter pullicarnis TaxID=2576829 RepID=UPI00111E776A|nr:YdcF family protein [Acinetobacter pullicarnis]